MPAWLAVIEQVPPLRSVTTTLAEVQTAGVVEVRTTGRPELAWAAIANGDLPKNWPGIESKVMVWGACAESLANAARRPKNKVAAVLADRFMSVAFIELDRLPRNARTNTFTMKAASDCRAEPCPV